MRVLLVGIRNWGLLYDLRKTLIAEGIDVDLLDPLDGFLWKRNDTKIPFGKLCHSNNFLAKNYILWRNFRAAKKLFDFQSQEYDVCNVHFLDVRYFFFKKLLTKVAQKLIISTYGTDFYKYKKYSFFQKPLYKAANTITFSNIILLESFNAFYTNRWSDKTAICSFGLSKLQLIKEIRNTKHIETIKKAFDIPLDKIIITVGYHSNPITQHLKILEAIALLHPRMKERIFIVFPMTYGGSPDYITEVEASAGLKNIPFVTIRGFRSDEEIASLRIASDILINLPKSDQLSATMCEYIYTENYVITGKWLPYDPIDNLKINYSRINSFDDLPTVLNDVIQNLESIKPGLSGNQNLIWDFSSWDTVIHSWIRTYTK